MLVRKFMLSLIAASTFMLLACDNNGSKGDVKTENSQATRSQTPPATTATAQPEMVTVTHVKGEIAIPKHPQRVIVFDMAMLDILDALEVPILGVPQTSAALPDELAKYRGAPYINAGTLFEPNFEAINAAQPDLIIGGSRARDAYNELNAIAPTLDLSLDTQHFLASLEERVRLLAKIFDKVPQAEQLLDRLHQSIAVTSEQAKKSGTALVIMVVGNKMSTYGPGSRFGFIFDVLGFESATKAFQSTGTHGDAITNELLLQANPDWLFVIDRDRAIGNSQDFSVSQTTLDNELVHKTKAYQNQHVVFLDSPALYISGGVASYQRVIDDIHQELSK